MPKPKKKKKLEGYHFDPPKGVKMTPPGKSQIFEFFFWIWHLLKILRHPNTALWPFCSHLDP